MASVPMQAEYLANRPESLTALAPLSGVLVHTISPLTDPTWETRLAEFPEASFFHTTAWTRVLHGTYGYAPVYLRFENPGAPPAALALMEVNSWLTGRRGIALPFTDECELLGGTTDSFPAVLEHLAATGRLRSWKYWEVRGGALRGTLPASVSYYGHRLALRPDTAALFSGFDSAVRRAIRKAEQEGVAVEIAQDEKAVRTFYDLLCKTRSRHGLPPQPYGFFEHIRRHVLQEGKGQVVLARMGQTAVAGAVFFHHGKNALYKFGASDEAHQQFRGNNLVLWTAIQDYARKGLAELDFGRTSLSNLGLRRFKLSWGAQERSIDYTRYDFGRKEFVTSADQASGGWHNRFFRSLPLGLSRLIGAVAYKHLA